MSATSNIVNTSDKITGVISLCSCIRLFPLYLLALMLPPASVASTLEAWPGEEEKSVSIDIVQIDFPESAFFGHVLPVSVLSITRDPEYFPQNTEEPNPNSTMRIRVIVSIDYAGVSQASADPGIIGCQDNPPSSTTSCFSPSGSSGSSGSASGQACSFSHRQGASGSDTNGGGNGGEPSGMICSRCNWFVPLGEFSAHRRYCRGASRPPARQATVKPASLDDVIRPEHLPWLISMSKEFSNEWIAIGLLLQLGGVALRTIKTNHHSPEDQQNAFFQLLAQKKEGVQMIDYITEVVRALGADSQNAVVPFLIEYGYSPDDAIEWVVRQQLRK